MSAQFGRDKDQSSDRRSLLTAQQVCERFHITDRTLARWLKRADLCFPYPTLIINRRRYWSKADIDEWQRRMEMGRWDPEDDIPDD